MEQEFNRVALFLDAENLIIEAQKSGLPVDIKRIIDRVREEGVISVARAYADWTEPHTQTYAADFYSQVLELTQLNSRYGKNTGDIQIVVDALEMALSANPPDTFVLIAGDRDFVPLVQRLRRHRKRVIGIGLQESTSRTLENACDVFLYYDHLVEPQTALPEVAIKSASAPAPAAPRTNGSAPGRDVSVSADLPEAPVELREAFELLLRAVISLERKGQVPTEGTTHRLMQQLDPRFDLSRYQQFSRFGELTAAGTEYGYVRTASRAGMLTLESARSLPTGTVENPAQFVTRFETSNEALQTYRSLLAEKRIPLVRWAERRVLVEGLWNELARIGEPILALQVNSILRDIAARHFMRIPEKAIEKLTMSLKIARALQVYGEERFSVEFGQNMLAPAEGVDSEEALRRVNDTYIRGIRMDFPEVPLQERALALLLFDRDGDSELSEVSELLTRIGYYRD